MTYGYFDDPTQTTPTYDPGLGVDCPICDKPLGYPANEVTTVSLMAEHDNKSYFYRSHKTCYHALTPAQITQLDSLIIDFVAMRDNDPILW